MKVTQKVINAVTLDFMGFTQDSICQSVGIGTTTLERWKKEPEYVAYMKTLEENCIQENLDNLSALFPKAIKTMDRAMNSNDLTNARQAAAKILDVVMGTKSNVEVKHSGAIGTDFASWEEFRQAILKEIKAKYE